MDAFKKHKNELLTRNGWRHDPSRLQWKSRTGVTQSDVFVDQLTFTECQAMIRQYDMSPDMPYDMIIDKDGNELKKPLPLWDWTSVQQTEAMIEYGYRYDDDRNIWVDGNGWWVTDFVVDSAQNESHLAGLLAGYVSKGPLPKGKTRFNQEYPDINDLKWPPNDWGPQKAPTLKADPVDQHLLERAFFGEVIMQPNGAKRFVARCDNMYDSNDSLDGRIVAIWIPEAPVFGVTPDYNLVLSLCTDGMHRTTIDYDKALRDTRRTGIWLPSTTNWHVYGSKAITWGLALSGNSDNPGYVEKQRDKGYCSLRVPWVGKPGFKLRSEGDYFEKAIMDKYRTAPPEPEAPGVGWDDLGWGE